MEMDEGGSNPDAKPSAEYKPKSTGKIYVVGSRKQLIPPGDYKALVTEIRPSKYADKRDTLNFFFEIAEGVHRGVQLPGFVNAHYQKFSEYCKLYEWYRAATGEDAAEEIKLDNFFDRILIVKVETKTAKKTGNDFSNVTKIMSLHAEF